MFEQKESHSRDSFVGAISNCRGDYQSPELGAEE